MVKNEAEIIERCLMSIMQYIDGYTILDTGSTDKTVEIMQNLLTKHKKPGRIYLAPFWDFGTNRSIVVQLAHQTADW
jgi:glycosyltransferase involved in cell wall biosynthesis